MNTETIEQTKMKMNKALLQSDAALLFTLETDGEEGKIQKFGLMQDTHPDVIFHFLSSINQSVNAMVLRALADRLDAGGNGDIL